MATLSIDNSISIDDQSVSDSNGGRVDLTQIKKSTPGTQDSTLYGLGFNLDEAVKDFDVPSTTSFGGNSNGTISNVSRPAKRQKKSGGGIFSCFGGGHTTISDDDEDDHIQPVISSNSISSQNKTLDNLSQWRKDAPELGNAKVSLQSEYPLTQILAHSEARRYLKLYASKEFSVENMLCWEALTDYLNEKDPKKKCDIFVTIVETFFAPNSPQHVTLTLDEVVLAQHKEKLESTSDVAGELEKIDEIVEEGKLALELTNLHDIYIRFKKSPDFEEMTSSISNFDDSSSSSSSSSSSDSDSSSD